MLHLVFSPERKFLGEVTTERGALERLSLNQEGEIEIGAQCQAWQTRGLVVRREMFGTKPDGTREIFLYFDRVQPREAGFANALGAWAEEHQYFLVELEASRVGHWEVLLGLPFEAAERFALLFALKHTPEELLGEWQRCLKEARLLVEHEAAATASNVLRRKITPHLQRVFG
jgi:hypothetical protein